MDTRTVVGEFLSRLGAGDFDGIGELFAVEVDWRLDWPDGPHPALPWIRARQGRADIGEHFRLIAEHHLPGGDSPAPTVLVDGADAVVLVELRLVAKPTGQRYHAMCALHLTVTDGRISRYHVYEDSLTVARAFGGA